MPLWGPSNIGKRKVKGLLRAWKVGAPSVRSLLGAFTGTNKRGRKASRWAIGKIGPWAIRPLGAVLRSGGKGVRKAALWILRRR